MADATAYEASSIDWHALSALAKRAAQETPFKPDPRIVYLDRKTNTNVDVLGPHWVLDHRFENFDDRRHAYPEEEHDDAIYALLPDGQLMYVQIRETCTRYGYGTEYEDDHTVQRMNESNIQIFDYATKYYENGFGTDCHVWGTSDRERGDLLHNAKGAGLSVLLEAVRTGQAKLPPSPSQFHTAKTPPQPQPVAPQPQQVSPQPVSRQRQTQRDAAFSAARRRALIAAAIGLLLCLGIWANDPAANSTSGTAGFAPGSYSVVIWTLILAVGGGLAIDLAVGIGSTRAFVMGALLGFALSSYSTFSKPNVAHQSLDISMFWLVALFGLAGYLMSALAKQRRLLSSGESTRK